ncbi:hypothetical protein [Pseudomonas sp. MWU12-2323]|uniref:hypothetical protein n=1 Tax=Pseudomonas sp. MWU12-2323 TaxID=2651296 RepID=UPI00128CC27E|nr:hypothetical protein [Pseudomonas sp. MWU12-2323]MPQ69467.1 hypothetical protein [Pseudomonas sp. MWU12-2323]
MTTQRPLHDLRLERIDGDAKLVAMISPCSFMYPGYGLQITVTLNGDDKHSLGDRKPMESATEAEVQALFDRVKTLPCKKCQAPTFDRNPAAIQTDYEGQCRKCINDAINSMMEAERQRFERELAVLKAEGKAKGFTHHVAAVIHLHHGDDYIYDFFTISDDAPSIERMIAKRGSVVTNDYRIEQL